MSLRCLSEPRRIHIGTAQSYSSLHLQGRNREVDVDRHVALWLAGNPPARHWALSMIDSVELDEGDCVHQNAWQ